MAISLKRTVSCLFFRIKKEVKQTNTPETPNKHSKVKPLGYFIVCSLIFVR